MMIYQVEAHVSNMAKEQINQELSAVHEMLALVGGGLFCAELATDPSQISIILRAKNEQVVSDVLEATDFAIKRIGLIGAPHETYVSFRGWRTAEARDRKKLGNYLIDFNPRNPLIFRQTRQHALGGRRTIH